MIVVDASVFNKLFLAEHDRDHAIALFEHCIDNDIPLLAPGILPYEAMSAAIRFGVPFADVFRILGLQRDAGMRLIELSLSTLMLAEKIASSGHEKSGYPELYDSIYHALALERAAIFVTADRRHFAKARQFGAIELLENWRNALG